MANMFAHFFPSTALVLAALLFPSAATADAVNDCKHARQADEKLRACSQAISRTNDRGQLEHLYLRRGNAYMELKLYADAKQDFSRLIEINPGIAGYFDNRMMASRELGQMQEARGGARV